VRVRASSSPISSLRRSSDCLPAIERDRSCTSTRQRAAFRGYVTWYQFALRVVPCLNEPMAPAFSSLTRAAALRPCV
jgi:hypothetical protein